MRAIVCSEFGSPDLLGIAEHPEPAPKPGEVLVRHRAWGLNYVDVLMCAGGYQLKPQLPFVPGLEAAGDVIALGAGVKGVSIGDRVMTSARPGAFCEVMALDVSDTLPIPAPFGYAEAAVFRSAYMTAWNALVHGARLQAGETLLVHGAAGGVGLAAVHVGRLLGAIVIATAGTDAKLAVVQAEGADHVINYSDGFRDQVKDLTAGQGVDVIYDPVGGKVAEESLRCMNFGCRVLYIGFTVGNRSWCVPTCC